jgi:MYXO-CTERM domain-containing protein
VRPNPLILTTIATLCAACNVQPSLDPGPSVAMQDSFEITLFAKAQDDLHTPYVLGSAFTISIASTDYTSSQVAGWTLVSSDPSVLAVQPTSGAGEFSATAAGAGTTTLEVLGGGGTILDTHVVSVAAPDSVQLCSHGLLLAGASDAQAQVSRASLVQGGIATFLVRYFQGGQELYGNHAVTTTATGAVTAKTTTSSFGDDRDWVEIDSGATTGTGQVTLSVGGQVSATVPSQVVGPSAITSVGVAAQSDANAADGDTLYVFGRAFDANDVDVYGATFGWLSNGVPITSVDPTANGPADMILYTYKQSATVALTAELDGDTSPPTTVHGTGATLTTSADVGCSIGPPGGRRMSALWGAVSLALLALRRRRRLPG